MVRWLDELVTQTAQHLPNRVREVLWSRGVSDEQIQQFRIGHLAEVPSSKSFPLDFLTWCRQNSTRLVDALVFPLTNVLGEVQGIQLRSVDRDIPGYSDFIANKYELVLFGLGEAMPHIWTTQEVGLVEGVFDLFPVQRHYSAVIATLTARVVKPLLPILYRLVGQVLIGYDNDASGRKASAAFVKNYGCDFTIRTILYPRVPMPGGLKFTKDPGDLWETWGETQFGTFVRANFGNAN